MDVPPDANAVLVRYGDMSTKSGSIQRMMEDRLVANIRAGLDRRAIDATIEREWTRPTIVAEHGELAAAAEVASMAFGVVSASPAVRVESTQEAILDAAVSTATATYTGGTFAIRARRSDKSLPFTSIELEHAAGDAVYAALVERYDPTVDLDNPDFTLFIEARSDHAYVFVDVIDGPGGLPVGSQAPLVALISGGIDSPVAAYRAMRRGSSIVPVYIDLGPYGGPDHQVRALEAIAHLDRFAGTTPLEAYVVPAGDAVERFVEAIERGRMLVLRRFMFRVADRIANMTDAVGIVTGEALGQKSSQTAANLYATSTVTDRPIHRPLLTMDKVEITDVARSIGTYRSASINAGCPSVAPTQVETRGTPDQIAALEPADMNLLVDQAVEGAEIVDQTALNRLRSIASD